MFVEVIAVSPWEAELVEACGGDRVEFVLDLSCGGLTPSVPEVAAAVRGVSIPVNVMIRPRPGGFQYSPGEMDQMRRSAQAMAEVGARGLVMGFLKDGAVDLDALKSALTWCPGMDFTFHRAIDEASDPVEAARVACGAGVTDLLTSGGPGPIEGNLDRLRRMVEAAGSVRVMAGGGITGENAPRVILHGGVPAVHLGRSVRRDNSPTEPIDAQLLRRMVDLIKGV